MNADAQTREMDLRLLLEDVCSDLVRYMHDPRANAFARARIDREWNLGALGAFADIRVTPPDGERYFVEIKTGYEPEEVVRRLAFKFGRPGARLGGARKVVVVLETRQVADPDLLLARIREVVDPSLTIELWDEHKLDVYARDFFGVRLQDLSDEDALVRLRRQINRAKAIFAFGGGASEHRDEALRNSLLWHFDVWRLKELRDSNAAPPADDRLVRPGHFEQAIVVVADLSSFTSFVRDTPDEAVVRASLTSLYTKARYQVIDAGGMLYQFVGDEVSAIFGVPDRRPGYVAEALRTARALLEIGRSVAFHWQQRIDRVQPHCAAHVGMAMGDLDLVAQRPFDVGQLGAFGDCLNVASRLCGTAGPDEIVISNVLRQAVPDGAYSLQERPALEIKNYGRVSSWLLNDQVTSSVWDVPLSGSARSRAPA